jgi:hypothetical protein
MNVRIAVAIIVLLGSDADEDLASRRSWLAVAAKAAAETV